MSTEQAGERGLRVPAAGGWCVGSRNPRACPWNGARLGMGRKGGSGVHSFSRRRHLLATARAGTTRDTVTRRVGASDLASGGARTGGNGV